MSQTIKLTEASIQPKKKTLVRDFLFSQVVFFYLVLLIFIVVSVTESGDFFNTAITHGVFGGVLGYAVATVFDLFSLVCMIARMNASRIADRRGMFLALVGVVICAGVSAFANVASAVQDYHASQFANIPVWMQQVSPYIGLVFPGMVIVVTLIADHIGDLNPQKADSVANYRAKEQKKIELLRVRLDIEKQRAQIQKEIALLHKKPSKKQQADYQKMLEEVTQNHQQIVANLSANYDAQMRAMNEQLASLQAIIDAAQKTTEDTTSNVTMDATNGTTEDDSREPDTEPLHVVKSNAKKTPRRTTAKTTPKDDFVAKVVAYQQRHPHLNLSQIAQHFGVSLRTVQRHLSATAETTRSA